MDYLVEYIKYFFVSVSLGLTIPGLFMLLFSDRPLRRIFGFFIFLIPVLLAIFIYPPIFREIGIESGSWMEWIVLHNRRHIWLFITFFSTSLVALAMLQNEKTESIGTAFFTVLNYLLFAIPVFVSGILSNFIGTIAGSWLTKNTLAIAPDMLMSAVNRGVPIGTFVSLAFLGISFLVQRVLDKDFLDWEDAPRQSCCYLIVCLLAASTWGGMNAVSITGSFIGGMVGIIAGSLVGLFVAGRILLSS